MPERVGDQAAVLVVRDAAADLFQRQVLADPFGDTDDTALLAELDAFLDRVRDAADQFVEQNDLTLDGGAVGVHDQLTRLRAVRVFRPHQRGVVDHVFQTDAERSLTCDRGTVAEPRGLAAHELRDVVALRGGGVEQKVAQLAAHQVNGGEETEREVDAFVVVIDRLGQMDDADALGSLRESVLVKLEFGRGGERIVAADGDEDVDPQRAERVIDGLYHLGGDVDA